MDDSSVSESKWKLSRNFKNFLHRIIPSSAPSSRRIHLDDQSIVLLDSDDTADKHSISTGKEDKIPDATAAIVQVLLDSDDTADKQSISTGKEDKILDATAAIVQEIPNSSHATTDNLTKHSIHEDQIEDAVTIESVLLNSDDTADGQENQIPEATVAIVQQQPGQI